KSSGVREIHGFPLSWRNLRNLGMGPSPNPRRGAKGSSGSGWASPRQAETELAAAAFGARARDGSTVRHDDLARDRQAEARAGPPIGIRRPVEPLEDPPALIGGNAGPLVPHAEANEALGRRGAERDETAGRRVFRGIRKEVH